MYVYRTIPSTRKTVRQAHSPYRLALFDVTPPLENELFHIRRVHYQSLAA